MIQFVCPYGVLKALGLQKALYARSLRDLKTYSAALIDELTNLENE